MQVQWVAPAVAAAVAVGSGATDRRLGNEPPPFVCYYHHVKGDKSNIAQTSRHCAAEPCPSERRTGPCRHQKS